jgi:hypothetical protein
MTASRLCREDNWVGNIEERPYAVRWATRRIASRFDWDWSKWHYTEGNGAFSACGRPVLLAASDGPTFPETNDSLGKVTCRACRAKMAAAGLDTEGTT